MISDYIPVILVFFLCGLGIWNEHSTEVQRIPMQPSWDSLADRTEPEIAIAYGQTIPTHRWTQRSLTLVPGISQRLAARILIATQSTKEDFDPCTLESISGIGPKLAGRIRTLLLGGLDCSSHL